MSDEIAFMINAAGDFAYAGNPAWHGFGSALPAGATIEDWVNKSGLGFTVKTAPVHFRDGIDRGMGVSDMSVFKDKVVTYREDNGYPLGVVSESVYKVVQPAAIAETIRQFAEKAGVTIETMGVLKGGRRIWALAKLDVAITLPGNDVSRPYFLITTSYDGETATIGTFTMVRVVCWNTITAALEIQRDEGKMQILTGFSLGHSSQYKADWAAVQAAQLLDAARQYEAKANLLAATGVSDDVALRYFLTLVGSVDKKGQLTAQSKAKVDRMVYLYNNGPGAQLESAKGTAFGLLNAVTRFTDYEARERQPGGRLNSAWYGAGKELKQKAFAEAMLLAA